MDTTMRVQIQMPTTNVNLRSLLDAYEDATLTTDHAASSHGLPVVVRADGQALGPAEVASVEAMTYVSTDDEAGHDIQRPLTQSESALLEGARRAGYPVR